MLIITKILVSLMRVKAIVLLTPFQPCFILPDCPYCAGLMYIHSLGPLSVLSEAKNVYSFCCRDGEIGFLRLVLLSNDDPYSLWLI